MTSRFADSMPPARRHRLHVALCAAATAIATAAAPCVRAQASDASTLSMLPLAVSVVAPAALLSAAGVLTVVAVETSAVGTVWVLERASDGARASVRLAVGTSLAVGTVLTATAIASGIVLSAAGRAVAFVPNALGQALLYDERITR